MGTFATYEELEKSSAIGTTLGRTLAPTTSAAPLDSSSQSLITCASILGTSQLTKPLSPMKWAAGSPRSKSNSWTSFCPRSNLTSPELPANNAVKLMRLLRAGILKISPFCAAQLTGNVRREEFGSMQPSFTLSEQFAFGSEYTWRLKETEIRFRGSGDYDRLVLRRIQASHEQIASFFAAIELIQVWDWRNDYRPTDCGFTVDDGSAWSFSASFAGRSCRCGGANAYPSFSDAKKTTIDRGRFAFLQAAMYDCFRMEGYIHEAKKFAEQETQRSGEPGGVPPERR